MMVDYLIVFLYFILMLCIGIISAKKVKNIRDFAIGDKKYSTVLLVTTILATWVGSESSIGMAEKVYSYGIVFAFIFFGSALNKIIIAKCIVPYMARFSEMTSIGDILYTSFGRYGKISAGIFGTVFCTIIVSAQITGIGYLFATFLKISSYVGMILGGTIIIFYTSFGGIKAVTITDVIQLMIIVFVIAIISDLGLNMVGGYIRLFDALPTNHLHFFPEGSNKLQYISLFILFLVPFMDPAITQRLLMANSIKQMSDSMKVVALIEVTFYFSICLMGLLALAIAPHINPDQALPYLVNNILPTGLKGFAIAGLLAMIMSTADSFLNAAAITFVNDFIFSIRSDLQEDRKLECARIFTVILGIFAMMISIYLNSSVFDIAIYSFYFWAPTILVPLYISIWGINKHRSFMRISTVVGMSSVYIAFHFNIEELYGLHPIIVSLFSCITIFYLQDITLNIWSKIRLFRTKFLYYKSS